MEDESDLRYYTNVLLRHWRLVIAVTLLVGIVALVVSIFLPAKYEATALAVITRPLYQFQFSPAIQNLPESTTAQQLLTGKAALDLATSDTLLHELLLQVRDTLPADQRSLFSFRKMLNAKAGSDPSIINFIVTAGDAERAAGIANAWASLYVRLVNDMYGQSADLTSFFEGELAQAKNELDRTDQALIEFERRNDSVILRAQLSAKVGALSSYLGMNESLIALQQNVRNLQEQLARRPADSPSSLGDDLAQLMLQIGAFSTQSVSAQSSTQPTQPNSLPIQLQMSSTGSMSDRTVGQQAAYLADLAKTIASKQAEVKEQAEVLPAEIKALQGRVQQIESEGVKLTRQRDLAINVYTTLAQKVKETGISAQDVSGRVRMAGNAVVPERPLSKRLFTNTAIALVLGFMAIAIVVWALEYFRETPETTASTVQEPDFAEESLDRHGHVGAQTG